MADIRWLIQVDMDAVLDIERRQYREHAWTAREFKDINRQRDVSAFVAEGCGERVVGFIFYRIAKTSIHILNIAVHPEETRCGVGRALVEWLIDKSHRNNRDHITLEISEANLRGQLFFKAMGFKHIRTVADRYVDSDSLCYVMERRIGQEAQEVQRVGSNPEVGSDD